METKMETKTKQKQKLSALIVRPSSINLGPSQAIVLNAVGQGYLLHIITCRERDEGEWGEYVML